MMVKVMFVFNTVNAFVLRDLTCVSLVGTTALTTDRSFTAAFLVMVVTLTQVTTFYMEVVIDAAEI